MEFTPTSSQPLWADLQSTLNINSLIINVAEVNSYERLLARVIPPLNPPATGKTTAMKVLAGRVYVPRSSLAILPQIAVPTADVIAGAHVVSGLEGPSEQSVRSKRHSPPKRLSMQAVKRLVTKKALKLK